MANRYAHAKAILDDIGVDKLKDTRVLVVGSGGIGCELLKNLVLSGFGHITLLDLDTIDLSNLNRQFLFRKKDVKQSKALVAAKTAQAFNPDVQIDPICANIKEERFDVDWFGSFELVLSALDNADARRHINRMCLAAGVPLVESGTQGYFGQVQPIIKDRTECFECLPKPAAQKTYPVCTIRSTPSQPIHCIVWAKSYLLPQLFGEEEDEGELDDAEHKGENASEIAALRKEAQAFKRVRAALRSSPAADTNPGRLVFDKVFYNDIKNLLSMEDMWTSRERPVPLEFDPLLNGDFILRGTKQTRHPEHSSNGNGTASRSGLRDQRSLLLPESLELFISSITRLSTRLQQGEESISFDKDDDDTLDFVTAASNLRSAAYNISQKNRFEVKEMAGNIIPAIATTNAIIAGLIVLQAIHILNNALDKLSWTYLQAKPNKPLEPTRPGKPDQYCAICRDLYVKFQCDPTRATLRDLVDGILGPGDGLGTGPRDVSVFEAGRVLADPDFEDNLDRTLQDLGCARGKFVTIVDEDGEYGTITVAICLLPSDHPQHAPAFVLPNPLPIPAPKPRAKTPEAPAERPLKRKDREGDTLPTPKKAKIITPFTTPSKAKRLEEDGLVILEDDLIELD